MSWCTISRQGNQFVIIRRPKISFNLIWCLVPRLRRSSRMKIVWNHLLVKFSCSISFHMRSKLSLLSLSGVCTLSNIYPSANSRIRISITWWFSKQQRAVAWKAENPQNSQKKDTWICEIRVWCLLCFIETYDRHEVRTDPWEFVRTRNSLWFHAGKLQKVILSWSSIHWSFLEE